MKPLFAYGTLRSAAWRATILGAAYPARPAVLRGYRRVTNASGYLSLHATGDATDAAGGVLIELDELGWRIADAWEDVAVEYSAGAPDAAAALTLYVRIDVSADTAGGPVAAAAYVCPDDDAGSPVGDDRLAMRSDHDVEAAIAAFVPRMRALRAQPGPR